MRQAPYVLDMFLACTAHHAYDPRMSDEKRSIRVPLLLTPEEAKELDDWQFTNRLRTRSDALREMMRRTIEASKSGALKSSS